MVRTARPETATSASVKCSRQHDLKCRLKSRYFDHSSQGNSTNYDIILGPRDKAAPPTSQQIGQFPPNRVKYRHCRPFFFFLPHPQESCLCSQPICRGKVRQTGRIFPEHRPAERIRSFLDPEGNRGHSLAGRRTCTSAPTFRLDCCVFQWMLDCDSCQPRATLGTRRVRKRYQYGTINICKSRLEVHLANTF